MSLQICQVCGWSKVTSYKGLRIHQGKKGCIPKGTRIPEAEQFRLNSYAPRLTYIGPQIEIPEPFADIFTSSAIFGGDKDSWIDIIRLNRREIRPAENTPANRETSDMRFNSFTPQLTFPGPSIQEVAPSEEITTLPSKSEDGAKTRPEPRAEPRPNDGRAAQGPRTQQKVMGRTPNGARPPQSNTFGSNFSAPQFSFVGPSFKNAAPPRETYTTSSESEDDENTGPEPWEEPRPNTGRTAQGPRTQQEVMASTNNGVRPPQGNMFGSNSSAPLYVFGRPSVQTAAPSSELFTKPSKSEDGVNTGPEPRAEPRPNDGRAAQGLRTQQEVMGRTPNGARPPQSNTFGSNFSAPQFSFVGPSFQNAAPPRETYTTSSESEDDENTGPGPLAEPHPNTGRAAQGPRTQQEVMGFTPNGVRPPQGNMFGSNSSAPPYVFGAPSVQTAAPSSELFSNPSKSEDGVNTGPEPRAESNGARPPQSNTFGLNSFTTPFPFAGPLVQKAAPPKETYTTSSEAEDDENTGPGPWAEPHPNTGRAAQGPRTQQEVMGFTPTGVRPPQGNMFGSNSSAPPYVFGAPSVQTAAPSSELFSNPSKSEDGVNTGPEPRAESNGARPPQSNTFGLNSFTTPFPFAGPLVQKAAPPKETYTTSSEAEDDENTGPGPWAEPHPNTGRAAQGPRTQQEVMASTNNGVRPPQGNMFGSNSSAPPYVFGAPSVQTAAPSSELFSNPSKSEDGVNTGPEPRAEPRPNDGRTAQGLRTHQEVMRCTPNGARPPQSNTFGYNSFTPQFQIVGSSVQEVITKPSVSDGEKKIQTNEQEKSRQKSQSAANIPANTSANAKPPQVSPVSPPKPAANEVKVETNSQSIFETPPPPTQVPDAAPRVRRALDFYTTAQQPPLESKPSPPLGTSAKPGAKEVKVEANNQSMCDAAAGVSRTLDFHSGAQQVAQLALNIPTTTSQETAVRSQEREKERQREEQEAAKAIHDRIEADIQLKILKREQKMGEVRSSAKACKGRLDAEWLEINTVFFDVIKAVEAARREALQPLEKRRQKVDKEEANLVQKLQKEIDELRQTIDELDQNHNVQVSPLTGQDESLKTAAVDTLFSFGTLRATTSNMMQSIQEKLEKLSSVELRRTPKYAVDVKLDPNTAHPYLHVSADGKTVCDGGKDQRVPLSLERFDTFGSILGLNSLTSGKSYWEVEVRGKSGWDLGVARGDANRKGKLSLNPNNRYWVIVHFENNKYAALTTPPISLALTQKPERVGVFVDYEEGLVSFYDVTAKSHIYSFTQCSFEGEIFPYFSPHLRQNEKNSAPLVITALKKQKYN